MMNLLLTRKLTRKRSVLIVAIITSFTVVLLLGGFSGTQQSGSVRSTVIQADNSGHGDANKHNTVPFYKTQAGHRTNKNRLGEEVELDDIKQDQLQKTKQPIVKGNIGKVLKQEQIYQISQRMETDQSGARLTQSHSFFTQVFDALLKGEPKIPPLNHYKSKDRIYHAGYDGPSDQVFSEDYLNSFLDMSVEEVNSLKESHSSVVSALPQSYPKKLYNGNGIVYVGGGKFNWLALLSIKSLRSLNCKLPVEVLIPTEEEYELELCSKVFPALNAKCVLLPYALGPEAYSKFKFKGYQYKALALIVSSFENVLLLDSDNIPAHAPDYLFDNEPFKSTGLVTWPDFWRRATSPNYYKIAGIDVAEERVRFGYDDREKKDREDWSKADMQKEVTFHDRKGAIPDSSSESGQLMISKSNHVKDLFLALYYNLYGPDYYYPLFSQGSDGEGDKETFLAASVALKSKHYQVKKFLNAFGHFNVDGEFIGCGMGQYNPFEDYEYEMSKNAGRKNLKDPRILFVHANFPKLNPVTLKKEGKIFEKTGERVRLYGPGMAKRIGYDFELVQWKSMHFLVCELNIELDAFEGESNAIVCNEIEEQLKFLKDTAKDNEKD